MLLSRPPKPKPSQDQEYVETKTLRGLKSFKGLVHFQIKIYW